MRSKSEPLSRRQVLRRVGGLSLSTLAAGPEALAKQGTLSGKEPTLENDVLRIALSQADGSFSIVDKRNGMVWRQQASPGFRVVPETVTVNPTTLSAKLAGANGTFAVTISFTKDRPQAFDLLLDVPGRRYTVFPGYPFPFVAPGKGWHYVQNTTGEGMLMPLEHIEQINKPFTWSGGQPWWGITDLKSGMR
jgi:hypothetical protein